MSLKPRRFSVLEGQALTKTVIARLNPVADILRDLKTKPFGARPYQVKLIWTRWSGGERGVGVEEVAAEQMILPTPEIENLNAIALTLQSNGTDEIGVVTVSEISPRYTEDWLLGRLGDGTPVPDDQNFYWEIFFPRPTEPGPRRRFIPVSAPSLQATSFEWTIRLIHVAEDRTRAGTPQG